MRVRVEQRWWLAVAVALALTSEAPGREKGRAAAAELTPAVLDALAVQYREAGLPLPPADAPLLLTPSGYTENLAGGHRRDLYALAFLTKAERVTIDGVPGTRLMGTSELRYRAGGTVPGPLPRRLEAGEGLPPGVPWVRNEALREAEFPVNHWLALAVQCHARGEDRLAREIGARGLTRERAGVARFAPRGDGSPRETLAASAWHHWMNVQDTAGSDRREVLDHLERLRAGFPFLDGPEARGYLASLRASMVPSRAAGSVEALVDALVEHVEGKESGEADSNDPNYAGLWERGFEAVPAMIAHLDDRRLTRSVTFTGTGGVCYPRRVDEVVSDLLAEIAGEGVFPRGLYARPAGEPLDRAAAAHWWAEASAMGEEAYMVGRVFPPEWVSLRIVAARYPQRLGEIYARSLRERPELPCDAILRIITGWAKPPPDERRRLLDLGVASPNPARSLEALGELASRDPAEADAALAEKLDRWPTELIGPYVGTHLEAEVSHRVLCTESAVAWDAYERAVRRASPTLRIEMLTRLADDLGQPQNRRRLALLGRFLDDPAVRVIRREDQARGGRFAGYDVPPHLRRLRVDNLVAWLIGEVLLVESLSGPMPRRGEGWWAERRATARAAIEQDAREAAQAPE